MAVRNSLLRYGSVAMSFHWLIAAFVLVNLGLGLYMADLPRSDPSQFCDLPDAQIHRPDRAGAERVAAGLASHQSDSAAAARHDRLLRFAVRASHFLLYFLIVAIPLAGWAMVSSSPLGLPTPYFGLFSWPNIPFLAEHAARRTRQRTWDLFKQTHSLLAV